jgi:hypothetical protein
VRAEGPVVHLEPSLLVNSRPERPSDQRDGGARAVRSEGQVAAHLVEVATALESKSGGQFVLSLGRLCYPEVDVAAPAAPQLGQGSLEEEAGDRGVVAAGIGVDCVLDGPAVLATGDMEVADEASRRGLARDKTGVALPTALDEVEPLVLAERSVAIVGGDEGEELTKLRDVALALSPSHLVGCCGRQRRPPRRARCGVELRQPLGMTRCFGSHRPRLVRVGEIPGLRDGPEPGIGGGEPEPGDQESGT